MIVRERPELTSQTLKGNWGTLLLPIQCDDSIDWKLLEEEVSLLIQANVDGIYSNGTAGEFHNQTEAEFDRIQQLLAEQCHKKGMRFQIGASHPSPVISLERIRRTLELKPDAFQVILPDWVSATPDEQVVFLQRMAAAAAGIPIVLYSPPHAKTVVDPQGFNHLKKHIPQLIGIKVAGGDKRWYQEMHQFASGISVFVPGHLLATGVREGVASGAYSNVACLNPVQAQKWWHQIQRNLGAALDVQYRIQNFLDLCLTPYKQAGYSNPALDKFLAAVGGWAGISTRLRWPYKWIPESDVAQVRIQAKRIIPEFIAV